MRYLISMTAAGVMLSLASVPSFADRASADACATKLPANAQMVYAATIGSVTPTADLKSIVRSKTRSLVMDGKLKRAEAKDAATAAGDCLKEAK
ncbi:MAG TPA: hypothetical protein VIJ52_02850 [Pseudolabrys sp.]